MTMTIETIDWRSRGVCVREGADPEVFFDETYVFTPSPEAEELCRRCPVRVECLAAGRGEEGVWGGLTQWQRTQVNRRLHRKTCPTCHGERVVDRRSDELCLACGMSWPAPLGAAS